MNFREKRIPCEWTEVKLEAWRIKDVQSTRHRYEIRVTIGICDATRDLQLQTSIITTKNFGANN